MLASLPRRVNVEEPAANVGVRAVCIHRPLASVLEMLRIPAVDDPREEAVRVVVDPLITRLEALLAIVIGPPSFRSVAPLEPPSAVRSVEFRNKEHGLAVLFKS